MEKIIITTKDGVVLHGNYVATEDSISPSVVLLHMMPSTKESWSEFQEQLRVAGFQSIAIDLRGHGESTLQNNKVINSRNFSDIEHRQSIHEVESVIDFLVKKGVLLEKIFLAGASIGANLSLQYQKEKSIIKASVLLSAGFDYKGIKTEPLAKEIKENQSVFLAGAKKDMRRSDESCSQVARSLFDILLIENKKVVIFDGPEHGTDLLRI